MATLLKSVTSEFSPRRKLRYFSFALLRAARVLYYGPTPISLTRKYPVAGVGTNNSPGGILGEYAYSGYNITNVQYLAIENLFKRPFRKSTASQDLIPWVKGQGFGGSPAGGASYVVGDLLTIVQAGGSGGKCVVASVSHAGGVRAVLPTVPGSGYSPGTATVTGGTGTGCILELTPRVGGKIDVMDQVRMDVQDAASGQTWYTGSGLGDFPSPRGTKTVIRDWGNTKAALGWLQSVTTNGTIFNGTLYNAEAGSVSAYGSGSYVVGNLATSGGNTYYCAQANTGSAHGPSGTSNTAYWVYIPVGGSNNTGQLLCPIGVALAAITGRLAAISGGLI